MPKSSKVYSESTNPNPFKSFNPKKASNKDVLDRASTLPTPFQKTHDMTEDTIEDVANETVFKEPIWAFSGMKLENFCKNLLRRNKKPKIVKSSSVENVNCPSLNGCIKEDYGMPKRFNTVGRSRKKQKPNGYSEEHKSEEGGALTRSSSSKRFKDIFRSRSKSKETPKKQPEAAPPPQLYKVHHSTSNLRQPFKAIPNEIQKLDREPKRRSGKEASPSHSFNWTQHAVGQNDENEIHRLKSRSEKTPHKSSKSHSDIVATKNNKDKQNRVKNVKQSSPTKTREPANVCDSSNKVSIQQVQKTFGKKPIIVRKTITTTKTTTTVIPQNNEDSGSTKDTNESSTRPSRQGFNYLSVHPHFTKEDYKEMKKRARSVEVSIPRKHQHFIKDSLSISDIHDSANSESPKRRACSITRKTNLCTIITQTEESYCTKKTSKKELVRGKNAVGSNVDGNFTIECSDLQQSFNDSYRHQQSTRSAKSSPSRNINEFDMNDLLSTGREDQDITSSNCIFGSPPKAPTCVIRQCFNEDGAYVDSLFYNLTSDDSKSTLIGFDGNTSYSTSPTHTSLHQSPLKDGLGRTPTDNMHKQTRESHINGCSDENDQNADSKINQHPKELLAFTDKIVTDIFGNVLNSRDLLVSTNNARNDESLASNSDEEKASEMKQVLLEQTCALSYFDGIRWVPIMASEEVYTNPRTHGELKEFSVDQSNGDFPAFKTKADSSSLRHVSNKTEQPISDNLKVSHIQGYIFSDDEPKQSSPSSSPTLVPPTPSTSPTLVPPSPPPTSPTSQPPLPSSPIPPTTIPIPPPLPEYSPKHAQHHLKNTLFSDNTKPSPPSSPCIKHITTHDYGEMYSIFHEIPQPILWLKARILTQYDSKDPFYHHILTTCSELRPGGWQWENKFAISPAFMGPNRRPKFKRGGGGIRKGRCEAGCLGDEGKEAVVVELRVNEVACEVPMERFNLVLVS